MEGQELRARGGRLSAPDPPLSTPEVVDLEPPSPPTPLGPSVPILRMVNSKRITLNFELKDSASSGTPAIDLWVTRDMRTWKKHEVQRPATGSYLIQVNDEGLYGFTLIARGSQGPQPIPHSGDLPQVWVTVDATPPVVQLAGVELSLTSREPALVVRWKAQDRNFNRKPITVSYAEQAEGPWVPLATGIDNTGRLELPVPANLPKRLYLRVERKTSPATSAERRRRRQSSCPGPAACRRCRAPRRPGCRRRPIRKPGRRCPSSAWMGRRENDKVTG